MPFKYDPNHLKMLICFISKHLNINPVGLILLFLSILQENKYAIIYVFFQIFQKLSRRQTKIPDFLFFYIPVLFYKFCNENETIIQHFQAVYFVVSFCGWVRFAQENQMMLERLITHVNGKPCWILSMVNSVRFFIRWV